MKRNHKIIAALIAALTVSGSALAQQGRVGCDGLGPMGMGPMYEQGGPMGRQAGQKFDPAQRAGRHLDALKKELKLTPEQEPLWQAFAEKAKENAGKGMQARAQMAGDQLTAPERMAKMEGLMTERLTAMKATHESFNRLYAALTPEQKAVADKHHAQMGQKGPGRGPGRGPGGPGGPGRAAPPQS